MEINKKNENINVPCVPSISEPSTYSLDVDAMALAASKVVVAVKQGSKEYEHLTNSQQSSRSQHRFSREQDNRN